MVLAFFEENINRSVEGEQTPFGNPWSRDQGIAAGIKRTRHRKAWRPCPPVAGILMRSHKTGVSVIGG